MLIFLWVIIWYILHTMNSWEQVLMTHESFLEINSSLMTFKTMVHFFVFLVIISGLAPSPPIVATTILHFCLWLLFSQIISWNCVALCHLPTQSCYDDHFCCSCIMLATHPIPPHWPPLTFLCCIASPQSCHDNHCCHFWATSHQVVYPPNLATTTNNHCHHYCIL